MATVDQEDSADLIANHLPHRSSGIGSSHSGAGLSHSGVGQNHFDNACSLLTQAQLVDNVSREGTDPDKNDVKQEQQLKKLTQLMENNNNNKNRCVFNHFMYILGLKVALRSFKVRSFICHLSLFMAIF